MACCFHTSNTDVIIVIIIQEKFARCSLVTAHNYVQGIGGLICNYTYTLINYIY